MISYTIKFHSKKFQNSSIPGESCVNFQMKWLNCQNFMTAHTFLTGQHLFTFFTVAPFLSAPSVILDFCIILVTSNTVIWVSLFGAHSFKLEAEDFNFHVVVLSKETFQTLAWKFHFGFRKKFSRIIFFLILFSCSTQLFKNQLNIPNLPIYFLSFSIFRQHVIVQTHRNKKLNIFIITCQSKEKNTNQIYLNC